MKGIGASQGYCIGKAWIKKEIPLIRESFLTSEQEEKEIFTELEAALESCVSDLQQEYENKKEQLGEEHSEIFMAHQTMLKDPEFKKHIHNHIQNKRWTLTYAIQETVSHFVKQFEAMDNAYFQERALDIKDIGTRLLKKVLGYKDDEPEGEHLVIVAKDLTPSDTSKLDTDKVRGFVTAQGGDTSHSAIIARTLGIPAIMGVKEILSCVKTNDTLILDGFTGDIIIHPSEKVLKEYQEKMKEYERNQNELLKYRDLLSQTACGESIEIASNIASPDDLKSVLKYGADGIGLFRSEFLYMNRVAAPSEEEQFEVYRQVLEGMKGKPVVIRTLDAGGDKNIPYLNIEEEMNPFLGLRAIRLCLENIALFKTQLRALLRASQYGNLKIMYPMISSYDELMAAKKILKEVKDELDREGIFYSAHVEEGIMIEVPSAVIIADMLAKEVDFFSIGTNDLIQYTTAVDRMNENIKSLYSPFHPAVIRLVHQTIQAAKKNNIWVGMCGSAAGDPLLFPLFLIMGLEEFSMGPNQMLSCRKIARQISIPESQSHLDHLLTLKTSAEVKAYLEKWLSPFMT